MQIEKQIDFHEKIYKNKIKMAFLCPVRMRRDKKKATNANIERDLPLPGVSLGLNHGMGRITGSSSIETLVRVGIEKEHGLSPDSKMVVLHDFTPCVDDELEVKRGQMVNILYRENDWVYVIGQDSRQEGFIPYSYCAPYNTQLADMAIKKKLPREQQSVIAEQNENVPLLEVEAKIDDDLVKANSNSSSLKATPSEMPHIIEPECTPFIKKPSGRFIVLYTFIARDENDLSVERGEFVTVLNRDDPDWFWIIRSDGEEGFVPASFIYPAETVLQTQQKILNAAAAQQVKEPVTNVSNILPPAISNGNLNQIPGLTAADLANTTAALNTLSLNANPLPTSNQQLQNQPQTQTQLQRQQQQPQQNPAQAPVPAPPTQEVGLATEDLRYHGTELVMLYDYKAQAPDDLSVRRGDWIYADLNNQTVDGWLWAYAPKTRKYGFIPKAYARPPAMTSL